MQTKDSQNEPIQITITQWMSTEITKSSNSDKKINIRILAKFLIRLQNKSYFFNLNWIFGAWLAGLSTSEVVTSSLSLEAPPAGKTVEAKSYWKLWEATSTSEAVAVLSEEASRGAILPLAGSGWPGGGRLGGKTSSLGLTGEGVASAWWVGGAEGRIASG